MQKIFYLSVIILILNCSKRNSKLESYTKSENGFYYQLLEIGDGNKKPKTGDIIEVSALMKTLKDSVFWNTNIKDNCPLYIPLNDQSSLGSFHPYLYNVVEGDSISFLIKPDVCFKNYFNIKVPYFCLKDSLLKIHIKVKHILSQNQYKELQKDLKSTRASEMFEKILIKEYLDLYYPKVKGPIKSIYILEKLTTNLEKITAGKVVKINYQGFLLDGKPIDNISQELEFLYGTPDQIIQGLNIAIGDLKKGEFTKIIIPSHLAFGNEGNSDGTIPPYTPLVYNLKIIDIK